MSPPDRGCRDYDPVMTPPAVEVTRSVLVDAPLETVWARVTSSEGIDYEMGPLLTMRLPEALRNASLADPPVGRPLGRAWLLLGGVIPVEYDDLALAEVSAPYLFHERSRMFSLRVWEHRRELEPMGEHSTRVTDRLTAVPRRVIPRRVVREIVNALFGHRHRRLAQFYSVRG